MNVQSEYILEENFITQLTKLGFDRVKIHNEPALLANLKTQLEIHNQTQFSQREFEYILHHLNKGNVFEKAKILRGRMKLDRDDGTKTHINFLNQDQWCKNQYQVCNQVKMKGKYKNIYDVTLLINGLPLVQIELKRRGLELKKAFNQINRYQKHSFWSANGLFQYVQLFVISNGVNTKYFANNYGDSFKQTFYWADEDNNLITRIENFAESFLEKCHLSKMICKYMVLHESNKMLMILRPYQYYAVEKIIDKVKHNGNKNGYIWHTTGSGKTLTSFKASQILKDMSEVKKVIFVVDRADLDYQTTKEFNHFAEGSVDGTDNTKKLVEQLEDNYADKKLIITTIQKLNTAISKKKYLEKISHLRDEKIIFIFDECHRSQFGETHKRINNFFRNTQMFGFTGTPIFADNAMSNHMGKRTTKDLFDDCLHKYVITNAIKDENVLKFSVEYWGKLKQKNGNLIDEKVSGINTKEFYESDKRINGIVNWIITNHDSKTRERDFSAMFCVGSKDALIKYYETFKRKKEEGKHDLKIATIFTYDANENDLNADGYHEEEPNFNISNNGLNKHSREKLDEFIEDYNKLYGTNFSAKDSKSFYNYYKDIAKRVKEGGKVDILLVVNMFLTGFDAKTLNTLYVDKNLKYHGLIQAFSRTNRILNDRKSQGNIVCFRSSLKTATDEAISLFSNKNAQEEIIIAPYEDYLEQFNQSLERLKSITPQADDFDNLQNEAEQLEFVKVFRELIRLKNVLSSYSNFDFEDLKIVEQDFEDYKSKYLDIYDKHKSEKESETESIIDDIDFELELIQRDEVNVEYILELLSDLNINDAGDKIPSLSEEAKKRQILSIIGNEPKLRSKRELIEKFIEQNLPLVKDKSQIKTKFREFWDNEKEKAIIKIREEEFLVEGRLKPIIEKYIFSNLEPLSSDVIDAIEDNKKPKILERGKVVKRIINKIKNFINIFEDDIGNV